MSLPYAPDSRTPFSATIMPVVRKAYPIQNADGYWIWSAIGPAEATTDINAEGYYAINPAGTADEFVMGLDENGSPVLME